MIKIKNKSCVLVKNGKFNFEENLVHQLKSKECLIRIKYTGVCSSDIYRAFDNSAYNYPLIMGHEISGSIYKVGNKIKNFKSGDGVVVFPLIPCKKCEQCKIQKYNMCKDYSYYGSRIDGGFSQYLIVNEWNLLKIPKNISYEDAACIEPMSIGSHAIKKVSEDLNNANKKILIIGSGFIGLVILEILNKCYKQKDISILDRNKFKLKYTKKLASKKILIKKDEEKNDNKYHNQYDIIFEASGHKSNFIKSLHYAKPGGKIIWLGNITSELNLEKKLVSQILRKELKITGSWNADFDHTKKKSSFINDWKLSFDYMARGVKPSNYISKKIKIEEIPINLKKLYFHKLGKKNFNVIKLMVENN